MRYEKETAENSSSHVTMSAAVVASSSLSARYFRRLRLDPATLDVGPTLAKLTALVEAHVAHVPFENLSQHGAGRPASLEVADTADKILAGHRGGFCYEVNGLLSEWLASPELGYHVTRIPAIVYTEEAGFGPPNPDESDDYYDSHICMMVSIDKVDYFVDVGHGEPPLHPLVYAVDIAPQTTPEGMITRFVKANGGDQHVDVERWNEATGKFEPSIRFPRHAATRRNDTPMRPLSSFARDLSLQYLAASPFCQKLLCCRITRTHKYTVAGTRLKITTPRFGPEATQTVTDISSTDEGRKILRNLFGMPWHETEGLDFTASQTAHPDVHGQY